jgi:hypothetical protein
MNTNPDETRLALWLEDELRGEELAAFEQWVAGRTELLEERAKARRWREMISTALPAAEDPPYPDFFNSRVAHGIREFQTMPAPAAIVPRSFSWRSWFMPLTACAGMVLAFWLGGIKQTGPLEIDVTGAPRAIPVDPLPYVPEKGVEAEWFVSADAAATVIVLKGVDAIPDATDFSETVYLKSAREMDSTAGLNFSQLIAEP